MIFAVSSVDSTLGFRPFLFNGRYICLNIAFTIFVDEIFLYDGPTNVRTKAPHFGNDRFTRVRIYGR